ncbi:MAG: hypothetical protein AB7L13_01595 [Acidimicrobiia bacterium]
MRSRRIRITERGYRLWMARSELLGVGVMWPVSLLLASKNMPIVIYPAVVRFPIGIVLLLLGVRFTTRRWNNPPIWTVWRPFVEEPSPTK